MKASTPCAPIVWMSSRTRRMSVLVPRRAVCGPSPRGVESASRRWLKTKLGAPVTGGRRTRSPGSSRVPPPLKTRSFTPVPFVVPRFSSPRSCSQWAPSFHCSRQWSRETSSCGSSTKSQSGIRRPRAAPDQHRVAVVVHAPVLALQLELQRHRLAPRQDDPLRPRRRGRRARRVPHQLRHRLRVNQQRHPMLADIEHAPRAERPPRRATPRGIAHPLRPRRDDRHEPVERRLDLAEQVGRRVARQHRIRLIPGAQDVHGLRELEGANHLAAEGDVGVLAHRGNTVARRGSVGYPSSGRGGGEGVGRVLPCLSDPRDEARYPRSPLKACKSKFTSSPTEQLSAGGRAD